VRLPTRQPYGFRGLGVLYTVLGLGGAVGFEGPAADYQTGHVMMEKSCGCRGLGVLYKVWALGGTVWFESPAAADAVHARNAA